MIAQSTAPDARHYTVQYELLRAEVLGTGCDVVRPDAASRPRLIGLAIMLREGMPGWLNAVEAVIRTSSAPRTDDSAQPPVTASAHGQTWPSGVPRHAVTTLLASLVLSTRRAEGSSPTKGGVPCH